MSIRTNHAVVCTFLLATALAVNAQNLPETEFSLTKPARVPGATLKAGHYTIHVLDRLADRYILEIRDQKHSNALTTFLAIPDESLPRLKSGIPIYWAKSGSTQAIRGMWVSGAPLGAGFVFPKADAAKLAQQVGQPVPAVDPDSEGKKEVSKMADSDRQIVSLWLLSAVAITPEGKETGIQATKFVPPAQPSVASAVPEQANPRTEMARAEMPARPAAERPAVVRPAVVRPAKMEEPMKMPKTASNFGGNLLAGLLLLGAGTTLIAHHHGRSGRADRT